MAVQEPDMQPAWESLASVGESLVASPGQIPLVASFCYYGLWLMVGRQLRNSVHKVTPPALLPYALDFVTTFELMGCSLENGEIRRHYGNAAYVGIMFFIGMWSRLVITCGAKSNPCSHVTRYMAGGVSLAVLLGRVACQTAGGLLSYRAARLFWGLRLTASHAHRYEREMCTTDLTVSVLAGFLIEFGTTYIDVVLGQITFTSFYVAEYMAKYIFGCLMVVWGIELTGLYMNPINATNQTFGCTGITAWEHVVVYWLSVVLAGVLGVATARWLTIMAHTASKDAASMAYMTKESRALSENATTANGVHQRRLECHKDPLTASTAEQAAEKQTKNGSKILVKKESPKKLRRLKIE